VNVAFGATFIGWVGSLIWAFHAVHKPTVKGRSHGGESGLNVFINDHLEAPHSPPVRPEPGPFAAAPGPAAPQAPVPPAEREAKARADLESLARMRDAAALSAEEYSYLRQKVLDRLIS
jgi:hypothetical protein